MGSFDLRDKIHNYIRLALLEDRQIDITNIYPFWVKYYQRKDYTLYGIPIALKTLESNGLITLENSIKLIQIIQEISEKGYRHLLLEMTELYPPHKIIPYLEKHFDIENLQLAWFKLPTEYIDEISERTYNFAENKLIEYHRSGSIALEEFESVLYSNKFKKIESTMSLFRLRIRFKEDQEKIFQDFKNSKLNFEKQEEEYGYKETNSEERLQNGILKFDDKKFIKSQNLKPYEIPKYSDGNYTSLPNIDVFEIFDREDVKLSFQQILYRSLIHKTKTLNYFFYIYYHPGNILAMIKQYGNKAQFKMAALSFEKFIKLSSFHLEIE